MPRAYLDPWPWFLGVLRAERPETVDELWPRLALARRELLTVARDKDVTPELKRLTDAVAHCQLLGQPRRDQLLGVLAEAYTQLRRRPDRYPP
jgi:hypothetical protein